MRYSWKKIFYALTCLCFFASCANYVTYTDIYYIKNSTQQALTLQTDNAVVWDNNSSDDFQQVWYDSTSLSIAVNQTIRLHPIRRDFKLERAGDDMNVTNIVGQSVALIVGTDTIVWNAEKGHMFTNDTIWSFYNTQYWQTEKDSELPYTYHHIFVISLDKIERTL